MLLRDGVPDLDVGMRLAGRGQDGRQIQTVGLPVPDGVAGFQAVDAADHFVHLAEAEFGHDLPRFFGHQEQVVDHVFRLAGELLAQHRILGGDADRAGVQVALAHHDAAQGDQRRRGKAHLLGPQQGRDDHVAAGLQAAVGLQHHAAAQVVQHQRLMRLGDAQFPGQAGVFDAGQRRGPGAAGVAGDQDLLGMGLGHARGDRAHADFGDQLDADLASGLAFFKSWISWARSSIE